MHGRKRGRTIRVRVLQIVLLMPYAALGYRPTPDPLIDYCQESGLD
jgi:hypothetical protein